MSEAAQRGSFKEVMELEKPNLGSMTKSRKFSWLFLVLFVVAVVVVVLLFRPSYTTGELAEGRGVPGKFADLGDFGGHGQYCYKWVALPIPSQRFIARIEHFSQDDFLAFSEKRDCYDSEFYARELISFKRFLGEFSGECRIEFEDFEDHELGHLGSCGFGGHGLLRYFYFKERMVMFILGTKAF